MKRFIQNVVVLCAIVSITGLTYGYTYKVTNATPYDGWAAIHFVAPGVCSPTVRDVPAGKTVDFSDGSGCLARMINGQIIFNDLTRVLEPVAINCTECWYSGGLAGGNFTMSLIQEGTELPRLKISRSVI